MEINIKKRIRMVNRKAEIYVRLQELELEKNKLCIELLEINEVLW